LFANQRQKGGQISSARNGKMRGSARSNPSGK